MWQGTGQALGWFARLVRGLFAAAVLVALLAGLPWALTHFLGWPLPDHLPTWAEIQGVLLGPMTTVFLLDFLACLTWLVWAFFTLDVARYAVGIIRDARMPELLATGPTRRVAAVLVGAVLISILGQRAGLSATSSATGAAMNEVVATAPPRGTPSDWTALAGAQQTTHGVQHRQEASTPSVERTSRAKSAVVLPYTPETGVHDSLWRMSERTLGDGHRWPEIYALNQGKPQPDGGNFTRPGVIFPGEEMALPEDAAIGPAPPGSSPTPTETPAAPTTTSPAPSTTQPPATTTQASPATRTSPSTDASGEPGFRWGEELFVGLGVAAAVSAAFAVARRHQRRRYRPGSGDRSDLPVAPVVYQLRLAHLRADHDDNNEVDVDRPGARTPRAWGPPIVLGAHGNGIEDQVPVGVRDGREVAADLAAVRGLGLLGAGAPDAVRALVITILSTAPTTTDKTAAVIVPAEDLVAMLGRRAAHAPLPAGLHVTTDLDAALDMLESETLVRVGQAPPADRVWGPVVLLARAPGRQVRRVQAVLDNGSAVGVTGLLLGQWNAGVTAYVRGDGTISTTSPGLGEPLRGTRVFRLGDDHAADLLTLLRHADPAGMVTGRSTTADDHEYTFAEAAINGSVADTDLELPAAEGNDNRQSDGELEILGSALVRSPAFRLRPLHPVRPQAELSVQSDGESHSHDQSMPLRISVLGPPRVWWRRATAFPGGEATEREITSAFQPRLRELLVFLALHPDGASREALIAALWATNPPERTTNAMNTSLSRVRRAVAQATENALSDVVLVGEGRYRLNPGLVEVDYHRFAAAVVARRVATTDADRTEAYRRVVDSYTGPLADGMSTDWIETAREAIRRDAIDAIDAVAALARALIGHDPQQTLDLLEIARAFDPHNELIYRDIMRLQERLGQFDAITRTLTLLTTRLAEVDDRPTQQAVALADRLRRRHDAPGESGQESA